MTISSFFVPNRQSVSSITNANPAVVTTTQAHGYANGLLIRFFFPLDVGMNQLRNQVYEITVLNNTSFSIPVDSTNFDPYLAVGTVQVAQVIPVAENANSISQATDNNNNITPEL